MANAGSKPLKVGEQIYFCYGARSNSFLMENYGFTLDHNNPFASLEFRVAMNTNPKEKIKNASSLLPSDEILDDEKQCEAMTELVKLKANTVPGELLSYLRSALMRHNYEGSDKNLIMVSTPRIVEFEIFVVEWAIDLVNEYSEREKLDGSV